jgi:hypothetical protein
MFRLWLQFEILSTQDARLRSAKDPPSPPPQLGRVCAPVIMSSYYRSGPAVCLNLSAAVTGVRKMDSSPAGQSGPAESSRCHVRSCASNVTSSSSADGGRFVLRRIPHCVAFSTYCSARPRGVRMEHTNSALEVDRRIRARVGARNRQCAEMRSLRVCRAVQVLSRTSRVRHTIPT